jgi:hypothetical protein
MYRLDMLICGNYTQNYVEKSIGILKDIIFNQIQAFNLIQIFDLITTSIDSFVGNYYQ